nr:flagellar export protein FliJ [uncultured Holophaga sp.]
MAARFRFRLQSLLKLRKSLEEEAQRGLARELAALRAIERRIADLHAEHDRTASIRVSQPGQVVDLDFWKAVERYLVVLESRIHRAGEERQEAQARVAEARAGLTRAHQAHLTLVRLRERRQEAHALETLHQEIREADEMAVLRARFNQSLQSISLTEVAP